MGGGLMEINTSRAQAIQVWKKDHPELKSDEKALVQLNGADVTLEVWRIPMELLIYNIRNGRFAAELIAKEKELKHILDPVKKEDASNLFEQFVRKTEEGSGIKGWGIGLAIVKGVTEAHGGQVSVESDEEGTTFKINLPIDARPIIGEGISLH